MFACVVGLALVPIGCGGDDEESPQPSATATEDAQPNGSAPSPGGEEEVAIAEFLYEPETITVAAGTDVTWTNEDKAPHTATIDDRSLDTGKLDRGDEGTLTFDEPGEYSYFCVFHPFMKGEVVVE